jgi:hypothetical protein
VLDRALIRTNLFRARPCTDSYESVPCSCAASASITLTARAGIHAGEVELQGDEVRGIAVPRRGAHSRRVAARRSLGLRHRTRPALGLRDRLRRPGRVRAARLRLASQACDIGSLGVGGRATARTSPKPQSGPHVNRRRRDGWSAVCGVRPAMVRSSMEVSRPTTIAAQRREQPQLAYRRPHRGSAGPGSGSLAHRTGC